MDCATQPLFFPGPGSEASWYFDRFVHPLAWMLERAVWARCRTLSISETPPVNTGTWSKRTFRRSHKIVGSRCRFARTSKHDEHPFLRRDCDRSVSFPWSCSFHKHGKRHTLNTGRSQESNSRTAPRAIENKPTSLGTIKTQLSQRRPCGQELS